MSELVSYTKDGNIGVITVDSPPVNALSVGVRKGLLECMEAAEKDDVEALVLCCAGRTFIAGADISEFGKPPMEPWFPKVLDAYEGASKPVVAAIHGTALGGGLEIAMACHYRCAVSSAQVGQPEVLLGIIPGAGGTQRVPRLVGVEKALDIITGGAPVPAPEALKIGLIDELIEGDLREGAIAFAKKIAGKPDSLVKVRDKNDLVTGVDSAVFDKYRAKLAQRRRGFEAPQACVDAVEAATTMSFDDGMKKEAEIFAKLVASVQ